MKQRVIVAFKVEDGKTNNKVKNILQEIEHVHIGGQVTTKSGDLYRVVPEEGALDSVPYHFRAIA